MNRLLALAALGSACAVAAQDDRQTLLGLWRIDQAQREPILDRRAARLDFAAGGRLQGHGSCNDFSAEYVWQGGALKLGPIVSTRKACAAGLMEQEDRILTALEHTATARVHSDGLLELRDADGRGVLRGTRIEAR